ncbi:hypothetical protein NP92_11835 [Anoxybacillus gonensis]|uniref:NERD domain-containing protein n=1 Tax=Anoxybacillus gonensis TaxID=198467 RepID=A0AAW7TLZ8_9BACL|nr:hypothetical protein [Anoxybacillus gonensis]AKS39746.1 hypothetical protein AFK25_14490 [Anoxybacillus gonensis]KGP59797.1 hypothetical protein NP92_11835 [Anoxybacillus gonensis]MDO0878701.1 hypothetical protein [Anoxybacillus gonensis]
MSEIRIYAEVWEQGMYFKSYFDKINPNYDIKVILINTNLNNYSNKSIISLLRHFKKFDAFISFVKNDKEYPLFMIEFSTAVVTDDHELQRGDALYWAYHNKVAYMKISPSKKLSPTAGTQHGGGTKISVHDQVINIFKKKGVMIHIDWPSLETTEHVAGEKNFLSCPPYSSYLLEVLKKSINIIESSLDNNQYYEGLWNFLCEHKVEGIKLRDWLTIDRDILSKINDSQRYKINREEKRLQIKVNRFGHAMDPERGMLAFWRLLLGEDWEIVGEFHMYRPEIETPKNSKAPSYKKLFDRVSQEKNLLKLVKENIEDRGNVVDKCFALKLFLLATNTHKYFEVSLDNETYHMDDDILYRFLRSGKKITAFKNLLLYCDKFVLTGLDRAKLVTITWNKKIVNDYYNSLKTELSKDLTPLPISLPLEEYFNEDIVTYVTKEYLVQKGYEIVAISYPDAQGDRCVLVGSGREIDRTYVDIIALTPDHKILLVECKQNLNQSYEDCLKLKDLIETYPEAVKKLVNTLTDVDCSKYELLSVISGFDSDNTDQIEANIICSISYDQANRKFSLTEYKKNENQQLYTVETKEVYICI